MKKNLFFLILLPFILSCTSNEKLNREGTRQYGLVESGEKLFLLDSLTTQSINYLQTVDSPNGLKLAFYNEPMNKICIFDVHSGKEIETIHLHKDGPNFIGKGVTGFYYDTYDSIWVYRSWDKELILVDHDASIQEKRRILSDISEDSRLFLAPEPYPMSDIPIKKIKNNFVFNGLNGGPIPENYNMEFKATVIYDLEKAVSLFVNSYPKVYGKGNINDRWGTFSYRAISFDIGLDSQMVLSFPADDNIFVYNLESETTSEFFGGYSKQTQISPMSEGSSRAELMRHYLDNYQYAGVFYDRYNELYYRLVILPLKEYDLNDIKTQQKNIAVVILNSNFEKVGEKILSFKTPVYRNCFVSPEGFHINVPSENDDYLKFITLKLEKL